MHFLRMQVAPTLNNFNPYDRKTFDVHMHIGRFGTWTMKNNPVEPFKGREISSAQEQEKFMKQLGITKAIVMPHYTPDQKIPFEMFNPIALEATKLKNIYAALFVSPLPENAERTKSVLEQLPLKKVVALKMSPDSWPKGKYTPNPATWDESFRQNMELILEKAKKHDLVIQFHTGTENSDIMNYVPFLEEYCKKIKIQLVHMGGSAGGHFALVPRFITWLEQGYPFYCDTSFCRGFGPAWLVQQLEEHYPKGLKHVLFASDNPWGIFESEFWRIEAIPCSDKIKEDIFYNNACKVYEKE